MNGNEDLTKYMIQPYVSGQKVIIEMTSSENDVISMKTVDAISRRRVKISTRMKKQLQTSYKTSKYFKYPIIICGVLNVDEKNHTSLILNDIMLEKDMKLDHCSIRYSQRYENLVLRFLTTKTDDVKCIFSLQWSEYAKNIFELQMIKKNKTDKIVYKRDSVSIVPFQIEEDLWTDHEDSIVSFNEGIVKQRTFNDKQEIESESEIPSIESVVVQTEDGSEKTIVLDNIPDSIKIDFKKKASDDMSNIIGKKCRYREYRFEDRSGFVFLEII